MFSPCKGKIPQSRAQVRQVYDAWLVCRGEIASCERAYRAEQNGSVLSDEVRVYTTPALVMLASSHPDKSSLAAWPSPIGFRKS